MHLHGMSLITTSLYGEKKVKDLVIGDNILVSDDGINFCLATIKSIHQEDYDTWSKLTFNDTEVILDKESIIDTNITLLDEEIANYLTKDYSRPSRASILELNSNPKYIFINDIGVIYDKNYKEKD